MVGPLPLAAHRCGLLLAACMLLPFHGGVAEFTCPPAFYKRQANLIPIGNGQVYLPVFRYVKGAPEKITLAIVVLHGAAVNSDNYFGWVVNSEISNNQKENAVVVMPVFPTFPCNGSDWIGNENQTGETLRWSSSQWTYGQLSDPLPNFPAISSYEAVDEVIQYLQMEYVNLKRIDVVGYSEGADMGLLWSVLSSNGYGNTTNGGVRMRILLGSPNVYLYLNNKRPAQLCSSDIIGTGSANMTQCQEYLVPNSIPGAAVACPGYDRFPYGLDGLGKVSGYSADSSAIAASHYLGEYMDETMAKAQLPAHFAKKDVIFMVGREDKQDCAQGKSCPSACGSTIQGKSNLQRGLNYMGHLRDAIPGYEPQLRLFSGSAAPEPFFKTAVWADSSFGDIPGEDHRSLWQTLWPTALFSSGLFLVLWFFLCFAGCSCLLYILHGIYIADSGYTKNHENYEDFAEAATDESEDERQHEEDGA